MSSDRDRDLAAVFLAALPADGRRWPASSVELAAELQDIVARAGEMWGDLGVDAQTFVAYLAARAPSDGAAPFERLHPGDLLLACGCALGRRPALARFERVFGTELRGIVRRFARDAAHSDDLGQVLREKLFVSSPDRAAKILAYSGQGFLINWLRVTALRTMVDAGRGRSAPGRELPLLDPEGPAGGDLDLEFLRSRYGRAFRVAFAEAVDALEAEDRTVLRLHYRGLGIDQLAAIYHVHRSTAARRVTRVRSRVLSATRTALAASLEIGTRELDSVLGVIDSRLDASVERLLATPAVAFS